MRIDEGQQLAQVLANRVELAIRAPQPLKSTGCSIRPDRMGVSNVSHAWATDEHKAHLRTTVRSARNRMPRKRLPGRAIVSGRPQRKRRSIGVQGARRHACHAAATRGVRHASASSPPPHVPSGAAPSRSRRSAANLVTDTSGCSPARIAPANCAAPPPQGRRHSALEMKRVDRRAYGRPDAPRL